MTLDEIIGTWRTKDFPIYNYRDNIVITLYVHHSYRAILWIVNAEEENITLAEGILSINEIDNENFEIVFDGQAVDDRYLNLPSRLHIRNEPASFIMFIPGYGERYIEKLN